ncbi:MAG: ABC transporter permease [Candidatus Gracilibacteria bacterium]|nr:ABC transporter permease [Candidatus Gracilibacteria bacterium]
MFQILKIALKSLYNNKLRSFLSSLGIIIGVSTIVLVIAIGLGAQKSIEEQYANLAVTSILINPVSTELKKSKMDIEDLKTIKDKSSYISESTSISQSKMLISDSSNSLSLNILGVGEDFLKISSLQIQTGRFFEGTQFEDKSKYAVLGDGAALDFFGTTEDIIGKTINIGKKKLEIIGIFKKSGTALGPITYDDTVFLPYKTAEQITGDTSLTRLVVLAKSINDIDLAIKELGTILRESHKLNSSDSDDFRIVDQGSKVIAAKQSASTMTILLTGVAIIVLVVSGIGIMNVMFAGVAERIKEIGIYKSIGIRRNDILNIFLFESVILSIGGGIIGVILGKIVIILINYLNIIDMLPTVVGNIIAFCFAVFVGIFFGYYPAYKASKMDPVDALRN